MLSQVLHAVREEDQNREGATTTQVGECTQTTETGTQTETTQFEYDVDYASCGSGDDDLHGYVANPEEEKTQLLNRDRAMQNEGSDDPCSVQRETQSLGSSFC